MQRLNTSPDFNSDEYLLQQMRQGARLLKLVQIRSPKYTLFGPSVTSTGYETMHSSGSVVEQVRLLMRQMGTIVQLLLGETPVSTTVQAKL